MAARYTLGNTDQSRQSYHITHDPMYDATKMQMYPDSQDLIMWENPWVKANSSSRLKSFLYITPNKNIF